MSRRLMVNPVACFKIFHRRVQRYWGFWFFPGVQVGAERGQSHSGSTRTTDDLTLRQSGRRTTLFRVDPGNGWRMFSIALFDGRFSLKIQSSLRDDPDDGWPHSAPTRTAQSDIKPLIPRPSPMNVLQTGDTIDHWPPGHEIMPKKNSVKSHACVPLMKYRL